MITGIVWKLYNYLARWLATRGLLSWEQHALPTTADPGSPPKAPFRFILENQGEVHLMTDDGAEASTHWLVVKNLPGPSKFWDQEAAIPLRAEHNT